MRRSVSLLEAKNLLDKYFSMVLPTQMKCSPLDLMVSFSFVLTHLILLNFQGNNGIRINKFFETDFTKNVNVKKQRCFDRSTVIFKLKSKKKNFMRLKYIQSIIKMLMR